MPTDQLAALVTDPLTRAVDAVLAGTPASLAALKTGVDPDMLTDAVATYQAAGRTALHRHAENGWYQVNIQFTDPAGAEMVVAGRVGPALDQLRITGAVLGWWFLRKPPGWRIRLQAAPGVDPATVVRPLLDDLVAADVAAWRPAVYEPEIAAFGGTTAMDTVHELFCADSHGVLAYLRQPTPGLGRAAVSLLLCGTLLTAAGLDTFERGDVFDRITQLRPPPRAAGSEPAELHGRLRGLIAGPDQARDPLFAPAGPLAHATGWRTAFHTAGHTLATAATTGTLGRGLRAVLTHIMIFHWNRVGLAATDQATLAHAARRALLPDLPR